MPNDPPTGPHILLSVALVVALGAVATSAFPATVIYNYVDDDGVPHFTDQWQLIPEKYRSRIQEIDQSTGRPFKPGSAKPSPAPSQGTPSLLGVRKEPAPPPNQQEPPFYAAWMEQFSRLSVPRPSHLQLGVGLLSVVILLGALKIIRVSPNPLVKLMLKGAIMAVFIGGAYVLYLMALQENLSKATAPLEKIKDATVGGAVRARDSMNQSYREQEKVLKKIESGP